MQKFAKFGDYQKGKFLYIKTNKYLPKGNKR